MPLDSPISLVPAAATDAEALVAIRIAAMRESLERIGRFDPARARDRFLSDFDPACTRFIQVEGVRVGFIVLKTAEQGLLLDHFYIVPAYQGAGIGAAVLAQVFAQADEAASTVRVGALRGSESNRFYRRHGFVLMEEGEFDNCYERPASNPTDIARQSQSGAPSGK
jgi:GNAT superfamily N-acetyltransferase